MNVRSFRLLLLLALSFTALPAHAADKIWDGGAGTSAWTTPNNWNLDVAPVATDSLFFAGSAQTSTNNGFAASTQFNGLTFSVGASAFTLAGNAINLAGNITNSSSSNQTISLALALQQNVIVNTGSTGTATSGGTTLSGIISGGFGLEKTGSGRLALTNANTFSGGIRISDGALSVSTSNTAMGNGTVTLGSVAGTENVLLVSDGGRTYANTIVVEAGSGTRTILNASGNEALTGRISLFKDVILDTAAASSTRIDFNSTSGSLGVTGSSNIIVRNSGAGTGVVNMAGNTIHRASFTGGIQVESGASFTAANGSGQLDISGASVTLASGATFTFTETPTIGGLNGVAGSVVQMTNGSGGRLLTLGGSGTYSYAGNLNNPGAGTGALTLRLNYGGEKGTQTFSGNNSLTGATALQAGEFILDYSTNNTSKLNDTGVLTLGTGTLELAGGNHTETVASTTINGGQVNITRTSGSATLSLGALTWQSVGAFGGSGVVNFSHGSIATTSTVNTRGILGDRARFTIAGANWAINDGSSNIVALASYDTFVGSGANSANNYLLEGSGTVTANQSFNTLKIATTGSGQGLTLGNRTLGFTNNGLLFTGAHDYAITTEPTGAISGSLILHNYGSGVLSLGRLTGETFEHAGTGKTVLTNDSGSTAANNRTGLFLDSGTLEFSSNNQMPGNSNLRLLGGVFMANTSGGNISLTNDSAGGHRLISLGADVPVIDVVGGGTLTVGGVISTENSGVMQATPLVLGSASSNGTIQLFGSNTYIGDTRLAGGRISVNSGTSLGSTSAAFKVIFSGNSTLNTTANIATNRYIEINSGVTGTIETDASTTLTHNGTVAGAGNLRKAGAGTLIISGTSTFTGNTTIAAGTLLLDATGTIASSSGVNLGTAASQGTLDITAKSAYTFGTAQTVSGYGTINIGTGKTVTVAGNLTPGNSPGLTSVIGGLALESSTATTMELATLSGVAGTDFDSISATEMLSYAGALSIVSYGGFNINQTGSYDLFDFASYAGNFDSVSVGGFGLTFDTIKTWAGTSGGNSYTFALDTGVLSIAVPEPATWALLAFSLTTVIVMRRRRS